MSKNTCSPSPKHAYKMLTPETPLLYNKTGVYKVYIIVLISAQKHRLWVLVRTASSRLWVLVRTALTRRF